MISKFTLKTRALEAPLTRNSVISEGNTCIIILIYAFCQELPHKVTVANTSLKSFQAIIRGILSPRDASCRNVSKTFCSFTK